MAVIRKKMKKTLRIGTRDSELALWQAKKVQTLLENFGYTTSLVPVKSQGDLSLDIPLYEMGITGVFTKVLDVAMLQGSIDIAVHSMKDVPTSLPKGIVKGAVLTRANVQDVLVYKDGLDFLNQEQATIATGSLRRKANGCAAILPTKWRISEEILLLGFTSYMSTLGMGLSLLQRHWNA